MSVLTPAPACDCTVCPFFMGDEDAGVPPGPEPICSGSNPGCAYCGCAATAATGRRVTLPLAESPCRACPIRCGSRVDIEAWMRDVGGTLTFDDIPATSPLPDGLPRYIPQMDAASFGSFDAQVHWPAYALGLRRWFSPRTHNALPTWTDTGSAREVMGLAPGQLAVLVGYGEDPLVEAFWTHRHSRGLIDALVASGFDLVLTPNFSMYGNQPRTEHLLNFRRNLLLAAELTGAGVPAIPNLYWFRKEDLDRYLAWIEDMGVEALAVNTQTFRTPVDWGEMALPGLTYLAASLPVSVRVVFTGLSQPARIAQLAGLFGDRFHIVAQKPIQSARHGRLDTPDGEVEHLARPEDLFAANLAFYSGLLAP
ncbi:MAG: DUF4417 domain-containing protein [Acidimicrobiales bacterium]